MPQKTAVDSLNKQGVEIVTWGWPHIHRYVMEGSMRRGQKGRNSSSKKSWNRALLGPEPCSILFISLAAGRELHWKRGPWEFPQ